MGNQIPARPATEQSSAQEQDLGFRYRDESVHKEYIYGQADGAIVINDYVDVDPYSFQVKKCQGNGLGNGILCVARVAFTDNYYGLFEVVRKGIYEGFRKGGLCTGMDNTGLPLTADTSENVMITANGNYFEIVNINAQTILYPTFTLGTGINLLYDATDTDGIEFTNGIRAGDKMSFVVGQDGAFHMKVKFSIEDVTGTDDCAIGFRKAEAYAPLIDDYDEMAAFNIIAGVINLETILNGGGTTTTDTTLTDWLDTAAHTLGIHVSAAGVVTYTYDGSAPTVVATFTFDDGEVLVPFLYVINDSDLHGYIKISDWEVGQD